MVCKEYREKAYTLKRLPYESLCRFVKAVAREKETTEVHQVQVREALVHGAAGIAAAAGHGLVLMDELLLEEKEQEE